MFFASLSFFNCVFTKSQFFTTLFVGCQIYFDKFYLFFLHDGYYSSERSLINCCSWILELKMLRLKQKCLIGMAPLIEL
jgi:hypothetical protein